jgi:hypothetical protein
LMVCFICCGWVGMLDGVLHLLWLGWHA